MASLLSKLHCENAQNLMGVAFALLVCAVLLWGAVFIARAPAASAATPTPAARTPVTIDGFVDSVEAAPPVNRNQTLPDVVVAFDVSGSMEFDTLCYGCWTPIEGQQYPEGARWPLPWNGPAGGPPAHCAATSAPLMYAGRSYIIIEAEEYSRNSVPSDRDQLMRGMTYWVMQRNGGTGLSTTVLPSYMRHDTGAGALGRDARGAYMAHFPFSNHTGGLGAGVNCTWADLNDGQMCLRNDWIYSRGGPFPAPRLDYDFQVPTSGTWYIWARGQGRDGGIGNLMWGINRTPMASVVHDSINATCSTNNDPACTSFEVRNGLLYNGARNSDWRWVQLGSQNFNANTPYELNLWAGGVGFALDRIIITTDTRRPRGATNADGNFNSQVLNNTGNLDNHRTGQACNPCDERFGGYPGGPGGDQAPHCVIPGFPEDHPLNFRYLHDIYDDEQPIRGAKEATASFLERFDPRYAQVGYVAYGTIAAIVSELECIQQRGADQCSPEVIVTRVTNRVRASNAATATNPAAGIRLGIDVLSNRPGHYGRPAATPYIVLLTDGEPNVINGLDEICYAEDYWPDNTGNTTIDRAKDCTVYYAIQAYLDGITIYTVTLGDHSDIMLMQYIAEITGGVHRHAPRPEHLPPIYEEIYDYILGNLLAEGPAIGVSTTNFMPGRQFWATLTEHPADVYRLHWCPIGEAAPINPEIETGVVVRVNNEPTSILLTVPPDAIGNYRLEAHRGKDGGCGVFDTRSALSAWLRVGRFFLPIEPYKARP